LVTWFVYIAAFLLWHDPTFAPFLLGAHVAHNIVPWLLLGAALLFWWPVVNAGPRFHRSFPAWLFIAYLLSVEVLNMVAGITIAFSTDPIYPHYVAVRAQLAPDALPWSQTIDQIMGGAIIWVFGSFVYISSVVFILFDLFRKDGSTTPQPLPDWDDNAKFIAPGLEHRVSQNELRKADLHHR
jgi:cytochrome c oxidase assembly factor CtaG